MACENVFLAQDRKGDKVGEGWGVKVIDMFVQKAATRRWEARVRGSLGPGGGSTTIDEADQWGRRRGKGEGLLNDGTNIFSPPECRCVDTVGFRSRQNKRQLKTSDAVEPL